MMIPAIILLSTFPPSFGDFSPPASYLGPQSYLAYESFGQDGEGGCGYDGYTLEVVFSEQKVGDQVYHGVATWPLLKNVDEVQGCEASYGRKVFWRTISQNGVYSGRVTRTLDDEITTEQFFSAPNKAELHLQLPGQLPSIGKSIVQDGFRFRTMAVSEEIQVPAGLYSCDKIERSWTREAYIPKYRRRMAVRGREILWIDRQRTARTPPLIVRRDQYPEELASSRQTDANSRPVFIHQLKEVRSRSQQWGPEIDLTKLPGVADPMRVGTELVFKDTMPVEGEVGLTEQRLTRFRTSERSGFGSVTGIRSEMSFEALVATSQYKSDTTEAEQEICWNGYDSKRQAYVIGQLARARKDNPFTEVTVDYLWPPRMTTFDHGYGEEFSVKNITVENVEVPAGTFKAVRIDSVPFLMNRDTRTYNDGYSMPATTVWIVPGLGAVKYEDRDLTFDGPIVWRSELVTYSQGDKE